MDDDILWMTGVAHMHHVAPLHVTDCSNLAKINAVWRQSRYRSWQNHVVDNN